MRPPASAGRIVKTYNAELRYPAARREIETLFGFSPYLVLHISSYLPCHYLANFIEPLPARGRAGYWVAPHGPVEAQWRRARARGGGGVDRHQLTSRCLGC